MSSDLEKLRLLVPFSGPVGEALSFSEALRGFCPTVSDVRTTLTLSKGIEGSRHVLGIYFRGRVAGDPMAALGQFMRQFPSAQLEEKHGQPVPVVSRDVTYFKVRF